MQLLNYPYPTKHMPEIHKEEFRAKGYTTGGILLSKNNALPTELNLLQYCSPIRNQLQEGDCTGEATIKIVEFWEMYLGRQPFVRYSQQFNYDLSRYLTGTLNKDSGSDVPTALTIPILYGAVADNLWPQNSRTEFILPPANVFAEATKFKAIKYEMVNVSSSQKLSDAIKLYMSTYKVPLSFASGVTDTLFHPTNGIVDVGTVVPNEGHNYVMFGFMPDPERPGKDLFICANSWGESYGIVIPPMTTGGCMYLTEDFVNTMGYQAGTLYYTDPSQPSTTDPYTLEVSFSKKFFLPNEQVGCNVTTKLNNIPYQADNQYDPPLMSIDEGIYGPIYTYLPEGSGGIPWSTSKKGSHTLKAIWHDPWGGVLSASSDGSCQDALPPVPTPTPVPTPLSTDPKIIDVYEGNNIVDWLRVVGDGVDGVICKATEGETYLDSRFPTYYMNAKKYCRFWGAYNFARPATSAASDEAKAYVDYVNLHGGFDSIFPILDMEDNGGLTSDELITWIKTWRDTIKKLVGKPSILYTYLDFIKSNNLHGLTDMYLWIADLNSQLGSLGDWDKWLFWQYTDRGSLSGVLGNVDMDRSSLNVKQLKVLFEMEGKILQRGDTGENVKRLQEDLNKLLNLHLVVDGIFGPITEAAVKSFQTIHRLQVDGIVGPATWNAIDSLLNPPKPTPQPVPKPTPYVPSEQQIKSALSFLYQAEKLLKGGN